MKNETPSAENISSSIETIIEVLHIMEAIRLEQKSKDTMQNVIRVEIKTAEDDIAELKKKKMMTAEVEEKHKALMQLMERSRHTVKDENIDMAINVQKAYLDTSISRAVEVGVMTADGGKQLSEMVTTSNIPETKELKETLVSGFKAAINASEEEGKDIDLAMEKAISRSTLMPSKKSEFMINSFREISRDIVETVNRIKASLDELRVSISKAFEEMKTTIVKNEKIKADAENPDTTAEESGGPLIVDLNEETNDAEPIRKYAVVNMDVALGGAEPQVGTTSEFQKRLKEGTEGKSEANQVEIEEEEEPRVPTPNILLETGNEGEDMDEEQMDSRQPGF